MARIMNGRDALPGEYPWIVFIDNRAFETAVRKTIILLSTHEFFETCHSVTFYFMKKKTPNHAVTPQCQSQFTPKMKANAVSRLLSSLV